MGKDSNSCLWKATAIVLAILFSIVVFMYYNKKCKFQRMTNKELAPVDGAYMSQSYDPMPYSPPSYAPVDNTVRPYSQSLSGAPAQEEPVPYGNCSELFPFNHRGCPDVSANVNIEELSDKLSVKLCRMMDGCHTN